MPIPLRGVRTDIEMSRVEFYGRWSGVAPEYDSTEIDIGEDQYAKEHFGTPAFVSVFTTSDLNLTRTKTVGWTLLSKVVDEHGLRAYTFSKMIGPMGPETYYDGSRFVTDLVTVGAPWIATLTRPGKITHHSMAVGPLEAPDGLRFPVIDQHAPPWSAQVLQMVFLREHYPEGTKVEPMPILSAGANNLDGMSMSPEAMDEFPIAIAFWKVPWTFPGVPWWWESNNAALSKVTMVSHSLA